MKWYAVAFSLFILLGSFATEAAQLPEFTKLVKKATPTVVNITATREVRKQRLDRFDGREVPEIFRKFFHNSQPQIPRPSAGSGFIISSDGYILTNYHVVEGANEIVVALEDRRERVATLIGSDPLSDLALLKIDEKNLPVVQFGNSETLEVGEWVVAIGSPFGFEYSVTAGIISAVGRSLPDTTGSYVPFIQTDVAINPGNSGGPLFNMEGKVIGINSQIFTRSGGFMGLSFAIPIDVAMEVVEQLKDKGTVSRGWLGVLIQRVDRDLAESFGLDRPAGALISQVFADSPAAAAGLVEGDIILEFDGKKIDLSSELPQVVGRTKAESKVEVLIVRNGKKKRLPLTVGLLPEEGVDTRSATSPQPSNKLGIDVKAISEEDKRRYKVKSGVLVTRVSLGPAGQAGIEEGDIITMIDNEKVSSVDSFNNLVENLRPDVAIPVRVVRGGSPLFRVIKIPSSLF